MRATHTWRRSTALESTTNVQAVVAGRSLRTTFTSDSPGCVQYQNPTEMEGRTKSQAATQNIRRRFLICYFLPESVRDAATGNNGLKKIQNVPTIWNNRVVDWCYSLRCFA